MSPSSRTRRKLLIWPGVVAAIAVVGVWFGYTKFFRTEPERAWVNDHERFKYGSIEAEFARGIPFYIWMVLPRIFPEYVPGPGGYKAFGLVWEPGEEMPVGFTKRTVGFPRVGNNCALCHTGTWRSKPNENPTVVVGAPNHQLDLQRLFRFMIQCGQDPRFNADTILAEIARETKLPFIDRMLYRFLIIPATREAFRRMEKEFGWMDRPGWPEWGAGRDDPMNLTKYFMTTVSVDESTGQADYPSVWNLGVRKGDGLFLNWSCDTPSVRSVVIDSALGTGAGHDPNVPFDGLHWSLVRRELALKRAEEIDEFLSNLQPPAYPFAIDDTLAAQGAPLYEQHCAACHTPGREYTSKLQPIESIGTDRERLDTWTQDAADQANAAVAGLGIDRIDMVKQEGYQNVPLDGLWMRAPYLHNGSVPNLREMLEPAENRTKVFYRGYDVYDQKNVGFVTGGPEAERLGWKLDTSERGNGNHGHEYASELSSAEKEALLEYLKTL